MAQSPKYFLPACPNVALQELWLVCVLLGRIGTGTSSGGSKGGSGPAAAHRIANQFHWKYYQFLQDWKHHWWAADTQPSACLTKQMEGGKLRVNISSLCPSVLLVGISQLVRGCDTCCCVSDVMYQVMGWWNLNCGCAVAPCPCSWMHIFPGMKLLHIPFLLSVVTPNAQQDRNLLDFSNSSSFFVCHWGWKNVTFLWHRWEMLWYYCQEQPPGLQWEPAVVQISLEHCLNASQVTR